MKSIVVLSSLVVMLFAGCGEQKSNGGTSSISDRISAVASNVDSPSEVTEKFIKACFIDKNYDEARKLSTKDFADSIEFLANKLPVEFTGAKVKVINEEINISTKIINGKLNGGRASVEVSMSTTENGQPLNGSHIYHLEQVDGQWLMDRF